MPEIALTGGIGVGKSTVAAALVERGAVLIDADEIVREFQRPGTDVFAAMVDRWGDKVITSEGVLDRAAVASIAFGDEVELAALNAIVHPAVGAEIAARRRAVPVTAVVVIDIPLLVPADGRALGDVRDAVAGVVVVDADPEIAVRRLVEQRDFSTDDARARMANQADREARLAAADFVIDNSGSRAELETRIDDCWDWIRSLAPPVPD